MHQILSKKWENCHRTCQVLLVAYRSERVSCTLVFELFNKFKEGRISGVSDEHEGYLSTIRNNEMIKKICKTIQINHHLPIRKLSKDFNILFGSVQSILTVDLGMMRVAA